jgi:hypothetical protein
VPAVCTLCAPSSSQLHVKYAESPPRAPPALSGSVCAPGFTWAPVPRADGPDRSSAPWDWGPRVPARCVVPAGPWRAGRRRTPPYPRCRRGSRGRLGLWNRSVESEAKAGVRQRRGRAEPSQWGAAGRQGVGWGEWNEARSRQKTKSAGHLAGSERIMQKQNV